MTFCMISLTRVCQFSQIMLKIAKLNKYFVETPFYNKSAVRQIQIS